MLNCEVLPFPKYGFGVCGLGNPEEFFLVQIRTDELPAVTDKVLHLTSGLFEELQEKRPNYLREEFGNEFKIFKGEWFQTEHLGFRDLTDGRRKLEPTKSYCYIVDGVYGYIDESFEAHKFLKMFRERGLTPLCHWQSRMHVNMGYAVTHRDLPDGYLLDNRTWRRYVPKVVPKCVPSLLDLKRNPQLYRGNPHLKYVLLTC